MILTEKFLVFMSVCLCAILWPTFVWPTSATSGPVSRGEEEFMVEMRWPKCVQKYLRCAELLMLLERDGERFDGLKLHRWSLQCLLPLEAWRQSPELHFATGPTPAPPVRVGCHCEHSARPPKAAASVSSSQKTGRTVSYAIYALHTN